MVVAATLLTLLLSLSLTGSSHAWAHTRLNRPRVALQASILPEEVYYANAGELIEKRHDCTFCNVHFATRNALFRHIRADPECSVAAGQDQPTPTKQRVALLFGYNDTAALAGSLLEVAFRAATEDVQTGRPLEFLGSTQSTIANSRANLLGLESDCPAAEDVLVLRLTAPNDAFRGSLLQAIVNATQAALVGRNVQLHCCLPLPWERDLHAEQSCTQHVFHYLIPLRWLPDTGDILDWYEHRDTRPTPPVLKRLKDMIRSAESQTTKTQDAGSRFNTLAYKERRAWHNYADPAFAAEASPNQEPVWRVLDRARHHSFVLHNDDQLYIVYEFSGDEFLKQQVRRLMGAVVAQMNGWLPTDFITMSLRPDVMIETPLAPFQFLYRAGSRFHFLERYYEGRSLFASKEALTATEDPSHWMQQRLLPQVDLVAEANWLDELQHQVAPRILRQLQEIKDTESKQDNAPKETDLSDYTPPPPEYHRVLCLLQDIVNQGQWPSTSEARSSIIRETEEGSRGSFTLVNPNGEYPGRPLKANSLFPDLAEAVYELETVCAIKSDLLAATVTDFGSRPPSSHCAVNCDAQFTPHVDSGRGAGQSMSMIVGLGDYSGGELMVEGDAQEIRYRALQFDGWKQRHWTKPFVGQRFSLVWFSPDTQEGKLL